MNPASHTGNSKQCFNTTIDDPALAGEQWSYLPGGHSCRRACTYPWTQGLWAREPWTSTATAVGWGVEGTPGKHHGLGQFRDRLNIIDASHHCGNSPKLDHSWQATQEMIGGSCLIAKLAPVQIFCTCFCRLFWQVATVDGCTYYDGRKEPYASTTCNIYLYLIYDSLFKWQFLWRANVRHLM